jgi:hypothetical protein
MQPLFSRFRLNYVETDFMILDYMFRLIKIILKSRTNYYVSVFGIVRVNSESRVLALSSLPSVCPHIYQRGSHCTDFREIWYLGLPRNSVELSQIWLRSDKNVWHFT